MKKLFSILCLGLFLTTPALAADNPDLEVINKIRDEGFNHSQVVEILRQMSDEIGPRLTASPQMRQARNWAMENFREWGLVNVHEEPFPFGRGWTFEKSLVLMTSPRQEQLYALPLSWTIGTDGVLEAKAVHVALESREDLENFEGDVEDKIVLVSKPRYWKTPENNIFKRFSEEDLEKREIFPIPDEEEQNPQRFVKRITFKKDLVDFLEEQGALAVVEISRRDGHMLSPQNYFFKENYTLPLPFLQMASEHYNRLVRLLENGKEVELELDLETTFYDDDPNAYNVIAEIPGKGRNPEIVMAGAHFDSWFVGDGAVDNGAGSAVVMEAMRILSTIEGFEPRRTIRAALWSGEEQGLIGSIEYVREHFGERPLDGDEIYSGLGKHYLSRKNWPLTLKDEHDQLSAYFNVDNGSGRFRGIYTEGNVATAAVFEEWLEPFHDVGATTVVTRGTGGTDHLAFQMVGLPSYQFIQDPLDYSSRLHHTQLDTFDHIVPEDLKQASVILASFLYHAAMREEALPRKPLPKEPENGEDETDEMEDEG